jgi:SOS-response transcriptional repressor LexA
LSKFIFMMIAEKVKSDAKDIAVATGRLNDKSAFQYYVLKTNRLEKMGLYIGDQLLIETSTALVAGNIVLIELDGKLLLRKMEQTNNAWMLFPLLQQLAPLEWPFHIPLPLVGVVRQIIRQF